MFDITHVCDREIKMVVESDPLVTAVITTYRRTVEIVRRALTSIINQTYSNIEIIIRTIRS